MFDMDMPSLFLRDLNFWNCGAKDNVVKMTKALLFPS